MKKLKNIILSTIIISTAILSTSCQGIDVIADNGTTNSNTNNEVKKAEEKEEEKEEVKTEEAGKIPDDILDTYYPIINDIEQLPQLTEVKEGETIATINTSMGDITIRFFEDLAPMACQNFLTLAAEGYYDGITFHRVIDDFMIQGGDPTGTGMGGESIYGGKFKDEITSYLRHFTGAVAYANSGSDTNGSQFYIIENDKLEDNYKSYIEDFKNNPKNVAVDSASGTEFLNERFFAPIVANEYIENGGAPMLDFNYTIFAQVIDGMDVVHQIAEVETATFGKQEDKPVEDVIINSITISTYQSSQK